LDLPTAVSMRMYARVANWSLRLSVEQSYSDWNNGVKGELRW
jgi:hypothetical protein